MKSSVWAMLAVAGVLCAQSKDQTEVRTAVVLPSYKDLKFPPLPQVKIPEPEVVTLPNGMKLYLLEYHQLPIVSGVALIRTGNLFDPADKRGLAQMTGDVLRSGGTKTMTGDQIDLKLENVAASVESQIGESDGTLSFSALKENTAEVLAVFHDVMTSPEFRQDKVDLEKTQMRSSIARRNDEANGILDREFASIVYGRNNAYGWQTEYSDVDHIQRQDLLNFYHRYYFPANVMLAVYGDFSAPEMKAAIEKLFADWTAAAPPVPKFPQVTKTAAPGIFLATKPDVTQTFFAVGHLGGVISDKDFPALEVTADILGGGFSSRLFQRIRTKLGYAYGINASWGANYDHPGLFEISGSTQSLHTVDTLRAIREELERIRSGEVTEQELQTAKDTVLNGFVFNFDKPSKTLNRLLLYAYFGYPKDFIFQYQKAIEGVTRADVLRVAKEYFRPQDLTIVAVGNPEEFKTPLTELGKVQPIDLTIPAPKKETAKTDAASQAKAKVLLQTAQQAMGGADKLAAIKAYGYNAEVAVAAGANTMQVKQHDVYLHPDTLRQDLELPFGKQS
ncbi:MAG: insulinase family protein, partial [Acidobacteriaceae bacterium]|nr:insulinase family protein [Acidobacteriaceae bacterium]